MSVTLVTDFGDLKIELFCEEAPKTCENFLALCASGYYNGCIFHRNIKGFMVQTGDPSGTGKGGKSIWGKKFEDEIVPTLKHNVRGVLSMANSGPNTNGSQFFITYARQPHLDMKYTVFGKVIDGAETLDDLEKLPVNEKTYKPLRDVHIQKIKIHANPIADMQNWAKIVLTWLEEFTRLKSLFCDGKDKVKLHDEALCHKDETTQAKRVYVLSKPLKTSDK